MTRNDPENTSRDQAGRFVRGTSGNPNGRPRGARNRATKAAEALLDGEAEALTRKAIELALGGDTTAMRLCLERLLAPRKDRPLRLDLPSLKKPSDVTAATAEVARALSVGDITPSEAQAVSAILEGHRKAIETRELEERITALEERGASKR